MLGQGEKRKDSKSSHLKFGSLKVLIPDHQKFLRFNLALTHPPEQKALFYLINFQALYFNMYL